MPAKLVFVVVVAVVAGLLLGLGLSRTFRGSAVSARVPVLDVRNLKSENAIRVLREHGFAALASVKRSTGAPSGEVVSESPAPGTLVTPRTLVTLTVATR
jgi:beta-lactam-binding protein with PASTA domain